MKCLFPLASNDAQIMLPISALKCKGSAKNRNITQIACQLAFFHIRSMQKRPFHRAFSPTPYSAFRYS